MSWRAALAAQGAYPFTAPANWREARRAWDWEARTGRSVAAWPEDAPGALTRAITPAMMLAGYAQGVFPWGDAPLPVPWWSPGLRGVLLPGRFHVSRRLRRRLRSGRFAFTRDLAFEAVVRACALVPRRGEEGTWITEPMRELYDALFAAGYGRSFEVWAAGRLVGGLFGVRLGRAFFAESMFSLVPDGSKMAMAAMMEAAQREGWAFVDCQLLTPHLARMGAVAVPRADYLALLRAALS